MNEIDNAIHRIADGDIKFNDFLPIGVKEHFYQWYYAESGLYIIRDMMVDALYLIEARSPAKALERLKNRLEEAMKAGSYYPEDYE